MGRTDDWWGGGVAVSADGPRRSDGQSERWRRRGDMARSQAVGRYHGTMHHRRRGRAQITARLDSLLLFPKSPHAFCAAEPTDFRPIMPLYDEST